MKIEELPESSRKEVMSVAQTTKSDIKDVLEEYEKIYNSKFVRDDEQFTSDSDRHNYVAAVIHSRFIARPPVREELVIPCGIDGVRPTKAGKMSSIFVLHKGKDKKTRIKRVSLSEDIVTLYRNVTMFAAYKVKIGRFGDDGDFRADNRTTFESPQHIQKKPQELIDGLKIPKVTCAGAKTKLSKRTQKGFAIPTDWRCIQGVISRQATFEQDGVQRGVISISDKTVRGEPEVDESGNIVYPGFTVWAAPELLVYEVESICNFYGSIAKDQKKRVSMNGYLILPVFAKIKEADEE